MAGDRLNVLFVLLSLAPTTYAITVDTVRVGNPGNVADTRYDANGFGSVADSFRMGKTEVTNAQYVEFLNAVASTDPYALYNSNMGSATTGGIVRSGSPGSYIYAVKADAVGQGPGGSSYNYANRPVNFVSVWDTMRFANWLHSGQLTTGVEDDTTTEDGAYDLNGYTGIDGRTITRKPGARWWLPSEDEWYKAAYYDPGAGTYFDYPTGTNSVPNNNLPSADTGYSANYFDGSYTTGSFNYPMTEAGAYTLSASAYGTFDQGGNVWELNETNDVGGASRGVRGGSWFNAADDMSASERHLLSPSLDYPFQGFRVASIAIPEPSTLMLATFGLLAVFRPRRLTTP